MSEPLPDIPDPLVSDPDWLARIVNELGGADPTDALAWRLPDGFAVAAARGPADVPVRRGPVPMRSGGTPWHVREDIRDCTQAGLSRAFGADTIGLFLPPGTEVAGEALVRDFEAEPLLHHIVAGSRGMAAVDALCSGGHLPRGGTLDLDPWPETWRGESAHAIHDWVAAVSGSGAVSDFRPACVDALTAHEAGATDTTELAIALSSVASWLDALVVERGMAPDRAAATLHVKASSGPLFFPSLARLRALRLGIIRVATAFGVDPGAARAIPVHVVTSARFQTAFDDRGNLLRAASGAAAAVIGGCDSLVVTPHDRHTARSEGGRRLALSLQAMLREEARLHLVSDPGYGSWYVEYLTDRIGAESWRLFQSLDAGGGLLAAVKDGRVPRRLEAEARAQEEAVDRRDRVLVGVNRYPDPTEPPPDMERNGVARPSARIEYLRAAMHPESRHGHSHPPVLVLTFGDRRTCLGKALGIVDYLGCAGIRSEGPLHLDSEEDARTAVRDAESPIVVLCGADADMPRYGAAARAGVTESHGDTTLVGAGRPPGDNPGKWSVDFCLDRDTPLVAGLARLLSAAGLRFESER